MTVAATHGVPAPGDGPDVELTEEQVRLFEDQGFLSLDVLTSVTEVDRLKDIYDRLFEPGAVIDDRDRLELSGHPGEAPVLPQIVNPDHYAPELLDTVAYRNASAIARQILGGDMAPMGMHAIRKPPRDGGATPWHQDEAYWDPGFDHRAISVWMPLQPATLDNGCMQFVAGTHTSEVQTHRLINPDSHGLVVTEPESVGTPVACPLPPGGATIHAGRTLHYAGPNVTDEPRRALIMAFAAPATPRESPRSFGWQRPEWSS
jgi:Phytanoyl-CoA dioxygenase (PhyH)